MSSEAPKEKLHQPQTCRFRKRNCFFFCLWVWQINWRYTNKIWATQSTEKLWRSDINLHNEIITHSYDRSIGIYIYFLFIKNPSLTIEIWILSLNIWLLFTFINSIDWIFIETQSPWSSRVKWKSLIEIHPTESRKSTWIFNGY